ncbi:uncharacterized protein OCT59_010307 [Rhizophagus irregularis]|uniref:uncharacterized protein n=1 Tax=Rhizophagus irregularis TaxID=588596 RepID=UPI00332F6FE9|nr:hypothetical protein OCT59_010307 [Rhizophagus irregularis]
MTTNKRKGGCPQNEVMKSNASYKLAFYEKDVKKILQKFSNNELNNIINETLAEQPKLAEENDNEIALEKN